MPDALPSPAPAVDSVTASGVPPNAAPSVDAVHLAKRRVLLAGAILYGLYMLGCVFLLLTLPDPTGAGGNLVSMGLLVSLGGALGFIGAGLFALKRISSSQASIATRRMGLIKVIGILTPGLLLSIALPFFIMREPTLPLDVVSPASAADLIAPVAVTLSAGRAAGILRNMGMKPTKYQWDTEGDGKVNEETVAPTTTVLYERQGSFVPAVRIQLEGGDSRRLTRRVSIPQAVFSMIPIQPIVEKPVKFSVGTLLTDPKLFKQVQWDFGDGNPPQTVTVPDIAHTFYAIGSYPISAVLQLTNQTQIGYKRTVTVQEQPPLPFPITLGSEPKTLFGPPPLGVLLRLETKETLKEVVWSFGDGKEERGANLVRQSHMFDAPGLYAVVVRARSAEGSLAELTTLVRVTDPLTLSSLQFEGKPAVQGNKISGEVPLEFSLTPKTATPLVQFSWEIPDDPNLQVQNATLTGVLRKEGTYTVTLLAQGAGGKSMRMPITITVRPPSAEPTILLTPDGGVAPLTVSFDASRTFIPPGEDVAGFKWLFGDEGQGKKEAELAGARVTHIYKTPGEYRIKLSVVLTSGKNFSVDRTIIVRRPTLSACITASRLTVEVGKGVEFDASCSTGVPQSTLWDVRRDDQPEVVQAQSSDQTYVYVFEEPGDYTVTLALKDEFGNQDKKSVSITVKPPAESPPSSSEPSQ